jgi:MFS family permease
MVFTPSRDARVNLLIGTAHFLSHFYILALPPLFLAWGEAFGVSHAALGLSVMLMSGITALLQTPVGFLVDRYGAQRFLVGGSLLMSLTFAAMGLATSYWQVLMLAALSGVGNSVIHPADYAILTGSIEKGRMGRSFAYHTFSGNLGFAAGPPVMAALMVAIGWRESLLLVGLLGVPVVGAILWQSRILGEQVRERARHGASALTGRQLLLSRPMLLFVAFFMLTAMAGGGVQSWLITVLNQVRGMDLAVASSALTGYMAGATGGTLVGGWIADRWKHHIMAIAIAATVLSAALVLVVGVMPLPDAAVIALMFAAGLALGSSRTPRDLMVRDAAPPGQIGKVFGFVSAGLPLGQAITPVPFGFLIDTGHPELVLVLAAAILLASLLCMGSARSAARLQAVAVAAAE